MNIEHKSGHIPQGGTAPATSQTSIETPQMSRLNVIVSEAIASSFTKTWKPEAQFALRAHIEKLLADTHDACNGIWSDVRITKEDTRFNLMVRQEQFLEVFTPKGLVENYQVDSRMAPKGIRAALEQSLLLLQHNVTTFAELREKQNKKGLSDKPGSRRRTVQTRRGGYLY